MLKRRTNRFSLDTYIFISTFHDVNTPQQTPSLLMFSAAPVSHSRLHIITRDKNQKLLSPAVCKGLCVSVCVCVCVCLSLSLSLSLPFLLLFLPPSRLLSLYLYPLYTFLKIPFSQHLTTVLSNCTDQANMCNLTLTVTAQSEKNYRVSIKFA